MTSLLDLIEKVLSLLSNKWIWLVLVSVGLVLFIFGRSTVKAPAELEIEAKLHEFETKYYELQKRIFQARLSAIVFTFIITSFIWGAFYYRKHQAICEATQQFFYPTIPGKEYKLTVKTVPYNSDVSLLNPKRKLPYVSTTLAPGKYILRVDYPGYETRYECVDMSHADQKIEVILNKKPAVSSTTACCKKSP